MTDPSSLPPAATWGQEILDRLELLARHSEGGPGVTRRLATPEHRAAHDLLAGWMAEAGMSVSLDAAANTVGRYEASEPGAPALMMGSHQDTVRQGGRYDGIMGVVIPLACIKVLHDAGERLPFALEVVAFSDEEGLRFGTGFFGSAAIIGEPRIEDLERLDEEGVSLAQALRDFGLDPEDLPGAARRPEELHGFVEVHIEQGPVLEAEGLPVGIVTDITHGANHDRHPDRRRRTRRHRADEPAPGRPGRRGRGNPGGRGALPGQRPAGRHRRETDGGARRQQRDSRRLRLLHRPALPRRRSAQAGRRRPGGPPVGDRGNGA